MQKRKRASFVRKKQLGGHELEYFFLFVCLGKKV